MPQKPSRGLVVAAIATVLLQATVLLAEAPGAGECSRRIRGEGEEDTLVILKPDAVRPDAA
jgi:hypothetical protein